MDQSVTPATHGLHISADGCLRLAPTTRDPEELREMLLGLMEEVVAPPNIIDMITKATAEELCEGLDYMIDCLNAST